MIWLAMPTPEPIASELRAHLVGRQVRLSETYVLPSTWSRCGMLTGYIDTIGPYDIYSVQLDGAPYAFPVYLSHCELLKDGLH